MKRNDHVDARSFKASGFKGDFFHSTILQMKPADHTVNRLTKILLHMVNNPHNPWMCTTSNHNQTFPGLKNQSLLRQILIGIATENLTGYVDPILEPYRPAHLNNFPSPGTDLILEKDVGMMR
jgi:hypothetical protein